LTGVYLDIAAQLGLLDRRLCDLIKSRRAAETTRLAVGHAIDFAGRSNSGFVVEGWIANGRSNTFSFLSADGLAFIPPSDVIYKARPDVSDHLRLQKQPVTTDDHGVLLSFANCLPGTDSVIVLREDANALTPVARIKVAFTEGRDRLLEVVSHAVGGGKFPRPAQAKKFYLPFFADARRTEEFTVNWIKPPKSDARISVIVPLYREYRFIFSLLTMQKRFSDEYEWLFVSDDPTQHQILTHILERRSYALTCPTALILNRFNYGYAGSNNIGAQVARGKALLFMNSDIWVDTPAPIDRAEKLLADKSYHIMGFRLLYEDGTVQHDGMSFRSSNLMHNLLLADHPRKGTPPDNDVGTVADVAAVTGALMMIDKDYFLEVGQFDKAYIKGDFEDADLCLKVRWLGGRVGLYKTNDIYHLERQSIRLMGGESSRLALTYLNCITFNERWSKFIREQKPAEMPGANVTALAAHKKARAV
jgi:GT2 family glycosyltransferase